MHEKDIKRMAVKQLKKEFPYWNRLTRKEKRRDIGDVVSNNEINLTYEDAFCKISSCRDKPD